MNILETAQHSLHCESKKCGKTCDFYCNHCHQRLCKQCRDEHLKSHIEKEHQVVPYIKRNRQIPSEKCKTHQFKDIDLLCEECQFPLCSRCTTSHEHRGHTFTDLEQIYAERYLLYQREIAKVFEYFLPTTQNLQKEISGDAIKLKIIMDKIRISMKTEAESLKSMVDIVMSQNMEEVNKIEHSLLEKLEDEEKTLDGYVAYLNDLVREFHSYPIYTKPTKLISAGDIKIQFKPIPKTTKPATPVFTTGQHCKEDIVKLLGKIKVPNKVMEKRETKPMISTPLTKEREFNVPGVENAFHMSLGTQGSFLVSDWSGNLIQTGIQQNRLQKLKTNESDRGYHTITQDGDLIFTSKNEGQIKKITLNNEITECIRIRDWSPISIHSSNINSDILVGMISTTHTFCFEAKVTRYNRNGKEIKNYEKSTGLYYYPHYITENINGDICTSDLYRKAVVVINKSGRHRFSYKGQKARFYPYGICTNILGRILVCDAVSESVHLLDHEGHLLSVLLTRKYGVLHPRCICVDIANNLYVGQLDTNKVSVFKYLS